MVKHGPTIAYEWLPEAGIMVAYHGLHEAEDAEWDDYIAFVRSFHDQSGVRSFVYSEGGRPTREQQQRLTEALNPSCPIAVVSPSTAVRFVVSVIALEVRAIQLFQNDQIDEAFAHLACTPDEIAAIRSTLERLKLVVAGADKPPRRPRNTQQGIRTMSREHFTPSSNRRDPTE